MTGPHPLLVGLTGGLASGKSTVADMLEDLGCRVVDADRLVAELYRPGAAGVEIVRELFGAGVLTDRGGVDPGEVAERVFGEPESRRRLEARIHPLVRERFREIAEQAPEDVVVLEATLLVEAGFTEDFDLVVTVEAPQDLRLERAVERGMDPEDARRRIEAQGDGRARRRAADRVLVNDGSLEELRREVEGLVTEIRAGTAGRESPGR